MPTVAKAKVENQPFPIAMLAALIITILIIGGGALVISGNDDNNSGTSDNQPAATVTLELEAPILSPTPRPPFLFGG